MWRCTWRPEISLEYHPSGWIHLIFWDKASYWLGAVWVGQTGWPVSSTFLCLSNTENIGRPQCLAVFTCGAEMELKFSWTPSKWFSDWAVSEAINIRIKVCFVSQQQRVQSQSLVPPSFRLVVAQNSWYTVEEYMTVKLLILGQLGNKGRQQGSVCQYPSQRHPIAWNLHICGRFHHLQMVLREDSQALIFKGPLQAVVA